MRLSSSSYSTIVAGLLILPFTYVAIDKSLNSGTFKDILMNHPIPVIFQPALQWILPAGLFSTSLLLALNKFRIYGFIVSTLILSLFTIYVSLILTNFFDNIPCSCGGISEGLSWKEHLLVNIFLLTIALIGSTMEFKIQKHRSINNI